MAKGSGGRPHRGSAKPGAGGPRTRPDRTGPPRREAEPPRPPRRPSPERDPNVSLLWGTHAVIEALRAPRRKPLRLFATEAAAERVAAIAAQRGIEPVRTSAEDIAERLPRDAVHQGLLLEARPLAPADLDDVPDEGVVLLLDQVTDPHNVGAILRTAAAFGVTALVMTAKHAPEMTGTLAKSASGGLEHVPVAIVVNLARALDELGNRGFFRVGLDSEGPQPLESMELPRPLALVLGAEGQGLRRLTRERCDALARLDMPGPIKSLNVSNACAVALTVVRLGDR